MIVHFLGVFIVHQYPLNYVAMPHQIRQWKELWNRENITRMSPRFLSQLRIILKFILHGGHSDWAVLAQIRIAASRLRRNVVAAGTRFAAALS